MLSHDALWLPSLRARLTVGPAPETAPVGQEILVRVRAVAVNPIDGLNPVGRRVVLPWLRYPAVLGSDVAGEVLEIGPGVTRFRVGDRVLGHAVGVEKSRNRAAEGAFQEQCILLEHLTAGLPDNLSFERAAVLPLALSTAACGLFQPDQLALELPHLGSAARAETVLVWGGSTSVGSNAIQLARNAGYSVVTTASPHNADYVRRLGAAEVIDYHSPTVVSELVEMLNGQPLAGTLAIGAGSAGPCLAVARRLTGSRRVASVQPSPLMSLRRKWEQRRGIAVTTVWGATLKDNEVGPAIYAHFLPAALVDGRYLTAPDSLVIGHGLPHISAALHRLRNGVSAQKIVVTL